MTGQFSRVAQPRDKARAIVDTADRLAAVVRRRLRMRAGYSCGPCPPPVAAAAWLAWQGVAPATPLSAPARAHDAQVGTAFVFVFLAYGGWSDAATLSAEMRDDRRGIVHALLLGLALVTGLYLLANAAYLRGLGLDGLAH